MKNLKTKNLLTVILSLLCVVLLCCSVALFSEVKANAFDNTDMANGQNSLWVDVPELTITKYESRTDGKIFNVNNVLELYDKLNGTTGHTTSYDTIESLVQGTSATAYYGSTYFPTYYDSNALRLKNGGKDIIVNFGGQKWTATYLTRGNDGHVILTLWLANSNIASQWGYGDSTYNASSVNYPADMYSSSLIRVKTLNAGGDDGATAGGTTGGNTYYAMYTSTSSYGSTLNTAVDFTTERKTNTWANFTLSNNVLKANPTDSTNGPSLTKYISKPSNLYYQEVECYKVHKSTGYTIQNEAYGTPVNAAYNGTLNYTSKSGYTSWQNDYLWLPSITETGRKASSTIPTATAFQGIWNTSNYQRENAQGTLAANTADNTSVGARNTWLRSSDHNAAVGYCGYMAEDGTAHSTYPKRSLAVRPAFHLDLTELHNTIIESDSPTVDNTTDIKKTTAWDGNTHNFNLYFEPTKTAITKIERKAIGGATSALYTYTLPTTPTGTGTKNNTAGTVTCTLTDKTNGAELTLKESGVYTVTLDLKDKNYSDPEEQYLVWKDTGIRTTSKTITIYVTPKKLTKPAVGTGDINGQEYTGQDITFTLSSPDTTATGDWAKYIQLDGTCPADLTDNNDGSFKASKVKEYKFKLKLKDEENTYWVDRGTFDDTAWTGQKGGSTNELTLKIKPRTLSTVLTNTDGWNWSVGKSGVVINLVITNFGQTSDIDGTGTNGQLKFKYYYANADGSNETVINASDITETFDATQGTANIGGANVVTGTLNVTVTMPTISTPNDASNLNYIFGVKPLTTSGMDANYTVSSNSAAKPFTVGTATIDLATLVWTYNADGVASNKDLAQSGHLTYAKNAAGTGGVEYEPQIMLYREDGSGNVIYDYSDANKPILKVLLYSTNGGSVQKASTVKTTGDPYYITTVKIELLDTTNFQLKATGNPSYIKNVDTSTNTAEIELTWYIDRAKVDLSTVKYEYGWVDDVTGNVVYENTYDGSNPPSFRDSYVYVQVKGGTNYPDGITNAVINSGDYIDDRDVPGTLRFSVNYTLDDNYYYENPVTFAQSFGTCTEVGSIVLAKKKISINWALDTLKDGSGNEILDDNGVPYQIYVLDFGTDPDNLAQFIKYEYYYADVTTTPPGIGTAVTSSPSGTTQNGQLDYLIDVDRAGKFPVGGGTTTTEVPIQVRAVIDGSVSGSGNYELNITAGSNDDYRYLKFGKKKAVVTVTVAKSEIEYGTVLSSLDDIYALTKGANKYSAASYTAVIYKGTDSTAAVDISTFDFSTANVGEYTIKFDLKATVSESDALSKTSFTFTISPKEIEAPSIVGKIEFNSETLTFSDYLDGKYQQYLDDGIISAVKGVATARDVSQNPYLATIEIINANYKWKLPAVAGGTTTKSTAKASLADDEVSTNISLDAAAKEATYGWKIAPYRLPADILNLSGKDGATVNVNKLPAWAQQLIAEGTLSVGVNYFADEAGTEQLTEVEFKGGRQYFVKPVISGGDYGDDSTNFTFAADDSITNTPAKAVTYKVPQSGATAALNNIKGFVTKTWLGLPIWVWMLIGLAVLLFLIIIIAIACKRRKNKEAREEKKAAKQAAKEEAAAKAEAEKARLESQRELEKMKAEAEASRAKAMAEAEAAKAKAQAEAEIAKIRAQAQAQMPAMPQQMPQQMPMQQHYQQPMQMPQQQQFQQMPMPQPAYGPQPQQSENGGKYAELKAEMQAMKAEQNAKEFATMKSEFEAMKMRMNMPQAQQYAPQPQAYAPQVQQPAPAQYQGNQTPEMAQLAELIAMTWRNINSPAPAPAKPAEPQQVVQAETAPVTQPAVYPPDAVITTTTTVDTTKNAAKSSPREESDRDRFFDVDGFYDKFEG